MQDFLLKIYVSRIWLMIFVVSQFLISRGTRFELFGDAIALLYIIFFAFLPIKRDNEAVEPSVPIYSEEKLLLACEPHYSEKSEARLHYMLHLINPNQSLREKISFAISLLNETFPEKTIAFYKCSGFDADFIAATRTSADEQVLALTEYDDTVMEMRARLDMVLSSYDHSKQYFFSKPIPIKQTENFESGFLIPVHFMGYLEGILAITGKADDKSEEPKIRIAESFAEGLALVIQNDRLYSKPKEVLERAEQISSAYNLISRELPEIAPNIIDWDVSQRLVYSDEYTGDFCDYIGLPNGDTMLIYGRCCTSGMGAAIFYLKLKAMIRCFASVQISPAQMLNKLSFCLNFDSSCDTFATVAAVVLSQRTREITISMAGAPSPVITRVRSGFAEVVEIENGIPLGLFNQGLEPYSDKKVQLMPGDGIVLYTEGVMGYQNKKGEFMDAENIKLALEQIPEQTSEVMASSLAGMLKKNKASKVKNNDDYLMIFAKTE